MQSTPPPAPKAPSAPIKVPTTPGPIVVHIPQPTFPPELPTSYGQYPVPQTEAELALLQAQRDALSNQIINVRDRRNEIARAYERATGADKQGLEQQLRILDQRLAQLEQDLAESGRSLAAARVPRLSSTTTPFRFPNMNPGQITGVSIVFILFVLGPLAASFGRLLWRRSNKPAMPPGWYDASHRLERLEQAVDTIAIEVERVSEGQRFITKLMTQGSAASAGASPAAVNSGEPLPALGPGSPAQFVGQNERDEVRVRRS